MTRQFRCDPKRLCNNAECCHSPQTALALGLGDYYRIAESLGKRVSEVWREYGSIDLIPRPGMPGKNFMAALSLLDNPCIFLDSALRCTIYKSRPIGCAVFPFNIILKDENQLRTAYTSFRCMQGIRLTRQQERLVLDIGKIVDEEAKIENKYFWNGKRVYVDVSGKKPFFGYFVAASAIIEERDPDLATKRSQLFKDSLDFHNTFAESGRAAGVVEVIRILQPSLYIIAEQPFAEKFDMLQPALPGLFSKTTRQMEHILRQYPSQ